MYKIKPKISFRLHKKLLTTDNKSLLYIWRWAATKKLQKIAEVNVNLLAELGSFLSTSGTRNLNFSSDLADMEIARPLLGRFN